MKLARNRFARAAAAALTAGVLLLMTACTPSADATSKLPEQVPGSFDKEIVTHLDAALDTAVTLSGSTGAIAGVWAPWAGTWEASPGTTTNDGKEPLNTDMRFRIGANTTAMTCSVMLSLVDQNQLKLDDPVSKYLPRVVGIDGITLAQLCQNTSGLADYTAALAPQFVNNPERIWPPLEIFSDGAASAASTKPGTAWANSSTGVVLLGMALESATGLDWPHLYQQYVFDRLGMDASSFPDPEQLTIRGAHPNGYATALNPIDGTPQCGTVVDDTELSNSMLYTAGGAVSDLNDMGRFAQALANGSLLTKATSKAQWKTVPLGGTAPAWQQYGLGGIQLGPMRGQAGAVPGFISAMLSDPSSGLTVVVMLNNSTSGAAFAQAFAQQLAAIASKAPAKKGSPPTIALPWSAQQAADTVTASTVCPPAPATPPAEPAPAG
ncbi:MAG: serine hydrolase domain-containing protein [Microbacteriaceae bacterium]